MSANLLRTELAGRVATIHLDDGKANALSPAMIAALRAALDAAADEADAVVLAGRPGRFSGGFDLGVMREGMDAARALVTAGAELAVHVYGFPKPLVAACTGHALAMGAFLLLACDVRIGAAGDFKIGLNETAIGMTVPAFGIALAQDRLTAAHRTRAVVLAEMYTPAVAVEAGFLDRVVDPGAVVSEATAAAARLASLHGGAVAGTKQRVRADTLAHITAGLAADMRALFG